MVQESTKTEKDSDAEVRKWSKPIMEKRRRERINRSLDELKRLVLEAQNRDSSRYTKLEKADILEMTVRHLRDLRRHHRNVHSVSDQHLLFKYRAGYNACVADVSKYMMGDNCGDAHLKTQILSHLAGRHRTAGLAEDLSDARTAPAFPYRASAELPGEEQSMRLHWDAAETRFSTNRSLSPYMVQTQRMLPSTGAIPVHYVPVLTHETGTPPGLHALVPGGPSPGLQLRDPLWRPW